MPHLTQKDNFRLGFLLRCAEEGCDMHEIRERIKTAEVFTKMAIGGWMDVARSLFNPAWDAAKTIATVPVHATALGIAGAAGLGAAGGYGLAKFQNSAVDPEDAKRQELISAYQLQADLARRRAQQRSYRPKAPTASTLF